MKILLFTIFLILFLGFSFTVEGKTSHLCVLSIVLKDNQNKEIENAEIKAFDESFKIVKRWGLNKNYENFIWLKEKKLYRAGTIECDSNINVGIRISAKGFELYESVIKMTDGNNGFEIKLKHTGTNETVSIEQLSNLYVTIQNLKKEPVPKIEVFLNNKDGNEIRESTDEYGMIRFENLTSGEYSIKIIGTRELSTIEYKGFQLPKGNIDLKATLHSYSMGNALFTYMNCRLGDEYFPKRLICELAN